MGTIRNRWVKVKDGFGFVIHVNHNPRARFRKKIVYEDNESVGYYDRRGRLRKLFRQGEEVSLKRKPRRRRRNRRTPADDERYMTDTYNPWDTDQGSGVY